MNNKGFTLIEVLLNFTLIIFFLTGTAHLLCHSLLVKKKAETTLKLASLASARMERFKTQAPDIRESGEESRVEQAGDESTGESYFIHWAVRNLTPDLQMLEMEVCLESRPRTRIQLVLYLSRRLGF